MMANCTTMEQCLAVIIEVESDQHDSNQQLETGLFGDEEKQ